MSDARRDVGPSHRGRVVAVRGDIVDAHFPDALPPRYHALRAGPEERVVLEVESHLSSDTVRCMGLTATRGLARGMAVRDTGGMLQVPVGRALLGRMLDVFGEPIDRQGPIDAEDRLPIHRPPLPLHQRVTRQEIFVTGVKVIDLLAPLELGGKADVVGASAGRYGRRPNELRQRCSCSHRHDYTQSIHRCEHRSGSGRT